MKLERPEPLSAPKPTISHNAVKRPEMEQAIIRLVIGSLLIGYYAYGTWHSSLRLEAGWLAGDAVMALWLVVCVSIIVAIRVGKPYSPFRRIAAITTDVANTTYFIYEIPDLAAPLFCLYLWFIIGHGFRFGTAYLYYTLALAFTGFTSLVVTQPYWQNNIELGLGLSVGMVAISLYLGKLVRRLTFALETAEAANLAKRQFVSSISHEMRTPLNAIIGMSDLLSSTHLGRDQKEMVRSLDSATKLLLALVDDVLDFSKIEAGKLSLEATPFNLISVIEDTLQLFRHQAGQKGLALKMEVQPGVPAQLIGDPTHLRQVLTNFLSNAVKFTSEGCVTLRVATLTVDEDNAHLLFEVEDTGIGISPKARAHIFDSFTQADPSTTRKYGGTGLGTTIAKQLVELMGGRVGFRTTDGAGSTFWFELTLGRDHDVGSDPPSVAHVGPGFPVAAGVRATLKNYLVLVADDNESNRRVAEKILERAGHRCVMVQNGEQALEMLEQHAFDIAILDMNMPDMSGIDVFLTHRYMRASDVYLPFIMLSADVSNDLQKECIDAGFDAFLSKPIQSGTLVSTVDRLVQTARGSQAGVPFVSTIENTPAGAQMSSATFVDFSALDQLDQIGGGRQFVNDLIDDFSAEASAVISQIECALALRRPAEAKRVAHALKGTALGVGATGLCAVCDHIESIAVSRLVDEASSVVADLRDALLHTDQLLTPYRASRQRALSATQLH